MFDRGLCSGWYRARISELSDCSCHQHSLSNCAITLLQLQRPLACLKPQDLSPDTKVWPHTENYYLSPRQEAISYKVHWPKCSRWFSTKQWENTLRWDYVWVYVYRRRVMAKHTCKSMVNGLEMSMVHLGDPGGQSNVSCHHLQPSKEQALISWRMLSFATNSFGRLLSSLQQHFSASWAGHSVCVGKHAFLCPSSISASKISHRMAINLIGHVIGRPSSRQFNICLCYNGTGRGLVELPTASCVSHCACLAALTPNGSSCSSFSASQHESRWSLGVTPHRRDSRISYTFKSDTSNCQSFLFFQYSKSNMPNSRQIVWEMTPVCIMSCLLP